MPRKKQVWKNAAKVECLKNIFRWSYAEVGIAVCKAPAVLRLQNAKLQRRSDFLISEVGLEPMHEPMYIAHRPIMVCLSLEGRLRPRYYLVSFSRKMGC
jgi:mTERF domain-containing protein